MQKKLNMLRASAIAVAFFALYALTAQRGLGWGDSGEFQYRILQCPEGVLKGCNSFATAHPLYIVLGKMLCHTPFQVTLLSSLFGALAVAGLFLCTQNMAITILFGLSHMVWWLSCLAEVQTLNLAFTVFEVLLILRYIETKNACWLVGAAFLTGVHLNCHNFALLSAPAYIYLLSKVGWKTRVLTVIAGCIGASYWISALFFCGFANVLVGSYGAQVLGLQTDLAKLVFPFVVNFTLASLSLVIPVVLAWKNRKTPKELGPRRTVLMIFFVTHLIFVARYFVPDQATFILPMLLFAYLLVSRVRLSWLWSLALMGVQLALPVCLYCACEVVRFPEPRSSRYEARHRFRTGTSYFAFPWKFQDDSADRAAAEYDGVWNGYPVIEQLPRP